MLKYVLILPFLLGCGTTTVDNVEVPPPPRGDEATYVGWFYLGGHGDPPPVHWVLGEIPFEDRTAIGLYSDWEIWVTKDLKNCRPKCRPSQTALVHELYHGLLDYWGDPDGEHLDEGWVTLVPDVNLMLREWGM